MTTQEILQACTISDLVVKLPDQKLDRKQYLEVAKALELIGGKWKGGKTQGFVFVLDPTELLAQIAGGEQRNLKKEYQFFETPQELANKLVGLAEISGSHVVCEPSAGQGAIAKAIRTARPNQLIQCWELMPINRHVLQKLPYIVLEGEDFLTCTARYDRIVANPPFTKNQDIEHIRHMYDCLKPGGILVSVASIHWRMSSNKRELEFVAWLTEVGAEILSVPAGTFKSSGTSVGGVIIKIRK